MQPITTELSNVCVYIDAEVQYLRIYEKLAQIQLPHVARTDYSGMGEGVVDKTPDQ